MNYSPSKASEIAVALSQASLNAALIFLRKKNTCNRKCLFLSGKFPHCYSAFCEFVWTQTCHDVIIYCLDAFVNGFI